MDFVRGRLAGVNWPVFRGDEDAAELGDHVCGRWLCLGLVPGGAGPVRGHVGGVVPGGGVPEDRDALAGEGERNGAVHRRGQPVAGLPGSEDLLGVFDRHPNLLPTAAAWNASLSAILASPIDRSMSEIIANAGQVHSHMREISSLVLLGGISHTLSTEVVERYAAEVALGLISQSADAGEMIANLRQLAWPIFSRNDPGPRGQPFSIQ